MRPKTYIGKDQKRKVYYGRFYRQGKTCLKRDLIPIDELDFKDTKRGTVSRSEMERTNILKRLYSQEESRIKEKNEVIASPTVRACLNEFMDHVKRSRATSTHQHYGYSLETFANKFGHYQPEQLEVKHLSMVLETFKKKGWASASINSAMRDVAIFLKYLRELGRMPRRLKVPYIRYTRKAPKTYTLEDMGTMEEYLEPLLDLRGRLLFRAHLMLRYTGIRASELRGMRWDQIDLIRQTILITSGLDEVKSREERTLPIHPRLLEFLQFQEQATYYLENPRTQEPFWSTRIGLSLAFKRVFEKLGIGEGVKTLHGYRHTFATNLLADSSVSPVHVQKLMGHKDLSTTMRYLNRDHITLEDTIKKLL